MVIDQTREQGLFDFDQAEFGHDLNEFFDRAFAKVEAGEMTFEQLERFLPKEMRTS